MKRIVIFIVILLSIISIVFIKVPHNENVYAADSDVYDVILFWGQSNMIGYMSDAAERYNNTNPSEVEAFSQASKIDKDILYNTNRMDYTKVQQQPNTVYEYKYLTNRLEEITANTKYFGEDLTLNTSTAKLEPVRDGTVRTLKKSYRYKYDT